MPSLESGSVTGNEALVADPELSARPVDRTSRRGLVAIAGGVRPPRQRIDAGLRSASNAAKPRERRRPCARRGPSGDTRKVDELDLARSRRRRPRRQLAQWQREHAVGDERRVHGRWLGPVPFATVAAGAGTEVVDATEGLGLAQWTIRRAPTLADLVAPRSRC